MKRDKDNNRYEDIINLPHHVSAVHAPMPASDRAAQFSPFAALTGLGEALRETGRCTEEKAELGEDARSALDERLWIIQEQIPHQPQVAVTYFQPDEKKKGGAYLTVTGRIKKIDRYGRTLLMQDGTRILIDEIVHIEGEMFP